MTSVLRSFSSTKEGLTLFLKPQSQCYESNIARTLLFPFTYSNGVLDITYSGNNFKETMVDIVNVEPIAESDTAIRIIGGPFLVFSLGNTFKDYIRSWRDGTIDSGSPINIHLAPTLLRVQEAAFANMNSDSGDSYLISTMPPSGGDMITGNALTNFNVTYIFKTPLVFTIVESGVTKYITFRSFIDQE
jgi:hypothetical protein